AAKPPPRPPLAYWAKFEVSSGVLLTPLGFQPCAADQPSNGKNHAKQITAAPSWWHLNLSDAGGLNNHTNAHEWFAQGHQPALQAIAYTAVNPGYHCLTYAR